jgi:diphosphomevalonate decarboxylase
LAHQNSVTAIALPNIALIKYWGDRDPRLRLPSNGSISMNLAGLFTRTSVSFDPAFPSDELTLNGRPLKGQALSRVSALLSQVRSLAGMHLYAQVVSENNFPTGAGIASSASAFAALALAASAAAGLSFTQKQLSRLARLGSGSACRSVPGGFVEWQAGLGDEDSYAFSIASPEHWALADCIALISQEHKDVGSRDGHLLAGTSHLQAARLEDTPRRLSLCRRAILERDITALAQIAEQDCHLMHAVMQTSTPPLLYWQPATLAVMQAVVAWRRSGVPAFFTIDAGPNVHVICPAERVLQIEALLRQVEGVQEVLTALPGGPARLEFS